MTVLDSDEIIIGGATSAFDFLSNETTHQNDKFGYFLLKLDKNGKILFNTLIPGLNYRIPLVLRDGRETIYFGGFDFDSNFEINTSIDTTSLNGEGYIAKVSPNGKVLLSSYLGGSNWDELRQISVDKQGNIFLIGQTESYDFPLKNPFDSSFGESVTFSGSEGFIVKIGKDADNDGVADMWELENGFDISIDDSNIDFDLDGLNNSVEFSIGTSPILFDTDKDGLDDGFEYHFGFDPLKRDGHLDFDNDLISNLDEYLSNTNPKDLFSFPVFSFNILYGYGFVLIFVSISVLIINIGLIKGTKFLIELNLKRKKSKFYKMLDDYNNH